MQQTRWLIGLGCGILMAALCSLPALGQIYDSDYGPYDDEYGYYDDSYADDDWFYDYYGSYDYDNYGLDDEGYYESDYGLYDNDNGLYGDDYVYDTDGYYDGYGDYDYGSEDYEEAHYSWFTGYDDAGETGIFDW